MATPVLQLAVESFAVEQRSAAARVFPIKLFDGTSPDMSAWEGSLVMNGGYGDSSADTTHFEVGSGLTLTAEGNAVLELADTDLDIPQGRYTYELQLSNDAGATHSKARKGIITVNPTLPIP